MLSRKVKKSVYLEGSHLGLENAKDLMTVADLAFNSKLNGPCIANIIMSFEELTKAIILKIKSLDNSLMIKDIDLYFKDHNKKHILGATLCVLAKFVNHIPEYDEKEKYNFIGWYVAFGIFGHFSLKIIREKFRIDETEPILEKVRQSGLYLDFDKVNKKWKSPKQFLKDGETKQILTIAQSLFDQIKQEYFVNEISREEVVNLLEIINYEY